MIKDVGAVLRQLRYFFAVTLISLSIFSPLKAGILVEGMIEGVAFRFEVGGDRNKVFALIAGARHLVDLEHDNIYKLDETTPRLIRANLEDDGASMLPYSLAEWSAGPPIAGHGSQYNVLTVGETICGEVLASRWMREFLEPVIRSVSLIQRLKNGTRPRTRGECGAIPFDAYAANGWPLMAGWKDATVFLTSNVRFDHKTDTRLFHLPGKYTE